jgi:hypothetical protein
LPGFLGVVGVLTGAEEGEEESGRAIVAWGLVGSELRSWDGLDIRRTRTPVTRRQSPTPRIATDRQPPCFPGDSCFDITFFLGEGFPGPRCPYLLSALASTF